MHRNCVSILLLAICVLTGCSSSSSPRTDKIINKDWKFAREDVAGAQKPGFDDAKWQTVDLPHTWNVKDGEDGGDDFHRGPAWYRKRLAIDKRDSGKTFFLRFEGAATVSQVYVNGRRAGEHRGNFGAFCFDVTDLMKVGGDNEIAVRVDNSYADDIAPLSGDFTIFGGIYRNVHLLVLDPLSISPLDDGSSGVYLKQSHVDDASAVLAVTTKVRNATADRKVLTASCMITDPEGREIKSGEARQTVDGHTTEDIIVPITIDKPHLWDGRRDPYLYRATVEVKGEDGKVTDRLTQPLGLRYYRIDPNEGLILNGRHYALHGVNRHQDREGMGWAIGPKQHDEDIAIITEMGCTGVRFAHFQQSDYIYSACDRTGLIAWAEDGLVNKISYTPAFAENIRQQVRELIKQNYNHPSIIVWSLFNELAMVKDVNPLDAKLIGELNDLAHAIDPTRLTTCASHKKLQTPEIWITDVMAFNRYFGWYSGTPSEWAAKLDELHAAKPDRCIGISEYGAGASIKQHEFQPTTRPKTGGPWHPEEWQCIVHEAAWKAMKQRRWLWCEFLWVMFDFAADQRKEGDHPGRNDKGLVTADRKIRKDTFYFYQANWTETPVVHITASRFNPRPSGPNELKVYSNCDEIELTLNGKPLGTKSGDDCVFIWADALLRDGKNTVCAIGRKGGKKYTDSVTWTASRGATTRLTVR